MANTSSVFTKTLTNGTFTVSAVMGFTKFSAVLKSGSATFLGSGVARQTAPAQSIASDAISMISNLPIGVECDSTATLDGIVITASSGTVLIVAS